MPMGSWWRVRFSAFACRPRCRGSDMPLVDFIRTHERKIIDEFEAFARTLVPYSLPR